MRKALLFIAALALHTGAQAQFVVQQQVQTLAVSPLDVQRLAPQLIAFAGSDVNFANLVNGLALGVPVTLTTPLATGGVQVVTFTPVGTMSAVQIAQTLEIARQSLIARGIATPTAQQIGIALAGGSLPTNLGATPVNGLIGTAAPIGTALQQQSPATAVQGATAGGLATGGATTSAAGGSTVRNLSDSRLPRGISDTPPLPVPGVTTPVQGATTEALPIGTPVVPAAPATITAPLAPLVPRTGDR